MGKLILIDGNAILHRAFHALPSLTTKRGEPINAVYGLISMLLRVIQDLKPTQVAVVFDEKEPTFRHKEFPSYQAQRPQMADELSSQFSKAKKVIEAFGVPTYSKTGYEGDDVIGTIADKSKGEVIIVSGDRDILQLVNSRVRVYLPVVGLSTAKLMGESEVVEKMGISPGQIPDYKALVGDPSDNYPGVAGIGPKTAVALLSKYKNLDAIYAHLKDITPSVREKLKKGIEAAKLSLKLATIVTDVPLDFDSEKGSDWDVDSPRVLGLFQDYGFKTLTERVKKIGKELDQEKQMALL